MTNSKFKVNFFRPHSDHARANMRLIILLAVIWAISVFGFQIMLMVLNQPTPEANYEKFQSTWKVMTSGEADSGTMQEFSQVTLAVLGKNIALKAPHKAVLQETLTKTVLYMLPEEQKIEFLNDPVQFQANNDLHTVLGLENTGFDKLMYDLLPTSLIKIDDKDLSKEAQKQLPAIMELYLVHNQSFLTDFRFLGFPFHYWYTAQFLLILFVVLCIIYAVAIDKLNTKYNFPD